MGKSNKKTSSSSDRINALRKQYDAFLEQDKKRKERNEYILEKLDKMRFSTALVPVRHKNISLDNSPPVACHLGYQQECSPARNFQSSIINQIKLLPDLQVGRHEDAFLIQEISKKYILIPKTSFYTNTKNMTLNQNSENVHEMHPIDDTIPVKEVKSNNSENSDWESKYEILNILKNEEKGTLKLNIGDEGISESNVDKESLFTNNNEQVTNNFYNKKEVEIASKNYEEELLEKSNDEYSRNDGVYTNNVTVKLQNIKLEDNISNVTTTDPSTKVVNYEAQPEFAEYLPFTTGDVSAENNVDTYCEKVTVNNGFAICDQNVSPEKALFAESDQVVHINEDEMSPMQIINPAALEKEINNDEPLVNNYAHDSSVEVPNVQDVTLNDDYQIKTVYKAEQQMEKEMYVDPTYKHNNPVETDISQTENPAETAESIKDFKTEAGDMVYSEHTDDNYMYQQGEYQQDQEYAYYEGTQPETYAEDINDMTVTQQQPHYEQEYVDSDQKFVNFDEGSNERQQYEHQPQQYQESEGYHQSQPEFEMMQYEQHNYETQEQVAQELDFEDGYNEQQRKTEVTDETRGEVFENQHVEDAVQEQQVEESFETEKPNVEEIPVPEQDIS